MGSIENQPSRATGASPRNTSDPKRVLVVDDSSSLRAIVREGLELRAGIVCEEAADGVDAIAKAKKIHPDLIVLDLAMPKLNGFEVAAVLHQELPKIPVVILTMYAEVLGTALANSVGVKAVVSKADGMSAVVRCVEQLLGS